MLQTIAATVVEKKGLLKPIGQDLLTETTGWVEKKHQEKGDFINPEKLLYNFQKKGSLAEAKLCVPTFKGFAVLKLEDIIVFEAEKNYTIIHLKDRKPIIVSRSLLEYEKILEGASFLRIHRSYLINIQHIAEYHRGEGGMVIMSNGTEVEISRRKKELFLLRIKKEFWK